MPSTKKNISNVGEVATAIRSVIHESRTRATEVIAAISGSSVINKIIAMPAGLTDDEMEIQIALEADQYIPYLIGGGSRLLSSGT